MNELADDECKPWVRVDPLVIDKKMRALCARPYPNHPKGCPNFGKKAKCPPNAPLITNVIEMDSAVYAIYNVFDFKAHCDRMREKHPNWTQRQVECCLYWQPKARKQLRARIKQFRQEFPQMRVVATPEAQGVNLTATMKQAGVEMEWPPVNVTYQIVLAGVPRRRSR